MQVLLRVCGPIMTLQVEQFPTQGQVNHHDSIYERKSSSHPSFMSICMRGVVIIHGILGLTRMRFPLGALIDCMGGVFVSLKEPNMSL